MGDEDIAAGISQISLSVDKPKAEESAKGLPQSTDFLDFMLDDDSEVEEEYQLHRQDDFWKIHPNILSQVEPPEADVVSDKNGNKMTKEAWTTFRDHEFLQTLLNLDNPKVSPKMLEFFMKDSICEILVGHITRVPKELQSPLHVDSDDDETGADSKSGRRSRGATTSSVESSLPNKEVSQELGEHQLDAAARLARANSDIEAVKRSYKVTQVLTAIPVANSGEDGSPRVLHADSFQLLRKQARNIFRLLFDAFQPESHSNLYHVCIVMQHIFEYHTDSVVSLLSSSMRSTKQYIGCLLSTIDCAPVVDLLVLLLLPLPSLPRGDQQLMTGRCSPSILFQYNRNLSKWRILLVIAERIYDADKYSDEVADAAANLLDQLMLKLKSNQNGELLLQPLGHCPELIQGLAKTAFAKRQSGVTYVRNVIALKTLLNIVNCAAEEQVMVGNEMQQPIAVKSQFAPLSVRIGEICEGVFPQLCTALMDSNNTSTESKPRKHSGYAVASSFTYHRLLLVRLLVRMATHRPMTMLRLIPTSVWRMMVNWMVQFPQSNMFHVAFVDLFQCALMTDSANDPSVPVLVQKCKAITVFIDACSSSDRLMTSVKGPLLKCLNILRLQADAQPLNHFLRQFLKSHATWRAYLPTLREETQRLTKQWNSDNSYDAGNGKRLPFGTRPKGRLMGMDYDLGSSDFDESPESEGSSLFQLRVKNTADNAVDEPIVFPSDKEGIDLGSPFANDLGFEGVVQVDEDDGTGSNPFGDADSTPTNANKKRKKKKKKKTSTGAAASPDTK